MKTLCALACTQYRYCLFERALLEITLLYYFIQYPPFSIIIVSCYHCMYM